MAGELPEPLPTPRECHRTSEVRMNWSTTASRGCEEDGGAKLRHPPLRFIYAGMLTFGSSSIAACTASAGYS